MELIATERFISFEGIDFSGKTTQIEYLKQYLENLNFRVEVIREPGGTAISEKIRTLLLDKTHFEMSERCEIFLYSAARTQLVSEKVINLLKDGVFVLADRYADSTTAYQGYGRGIDLEMVKQVNMAATMGVMPKITFYLKITPEQSAERRLKAKRDADRLESTGIEFYRRVFNGYNILAQENPGRFAVLDAAASKEDVHKKIIQVLQSKSFIINAET